MKEAGIFWAKLTGAKVIPRLSGERKGRRFGLESRSWAIYQQASSSARLVSEWPHLGSPEGQNTEPEGNEEQHWQQNEAQGLWNPARMMYSRESFQYEGLQCASFTPLDQQHLIDSPQHPC